MQVRVVALPVRSSRGVRASEVGDGVKAFFIYTSMTGRKYDLLALNGHERMKLSNAMDRFVAKPSWDVFAREMWRAEGANLPVGCALYRILQDLEMRLGISEGRIAAPDYRDIVSDLIEERFDTRDAFVTSIGISMSELSHFLQGISVSSGVIAKVFAGLGIELNVRGRTL